VFAPWGVSFAGPAAGLKGVPPDPRERMRWNRSGYGSAGSSRSPDILQGTSVDKHTLAALTPGNIPQAYSTTSSSLGRASCLQAGPNRADGDAKRGSSAHTGGGFPPSLTRRGVLVLSPCRLDEHPAFHLGPMPHAKHRAYMIGNR